MIRLAALLLAGLLLRPAVSAEPALTWRAGDRAFRVDGTPRLVLGRNPVAAKLDGFEQHFAHAEAAGERLMRIHMCYLPPDEQPGQASVGMTWYWDQVLDAAERHHLAVIPVFGVWADWNDGSNHELWHAWDKNPYNAARGGPAKSPAELLAPGACQTAWLKRVGGLVAHWAPRRCVVGWELFSELDMVTGADEAKATAFAEALGKVVRAADPDHRPLTASLSAAHQWPSLWRSDAVDLVQVHPYGNTDRDNLDDLVLSQVRAHLSAFDKPVLLGESGLNWRPPRGTLDASERAVIGIRHAVWAALVSGAMNARMLWWQDGYDQFEGVDLVGRFQDVGQTAAAWVKGLDATGLLPVECRMSDGLRGAALAGGPTVLGWFRDARCAAPDWPTAPTAGQWVEIAAADGPWQMAFVDPASGKVTAQPDATAAGGRLRLALPEFAASIAVTASRVAP
ncbi:MAG: hypothetical protein HZB16_00325 [Armatimonadetes bacterium]|nr:hypothetical protein [Armatimonadota bacterium]